MEERFGAWGTVSDGIFFAEGPIAGAVSRGRVEVEISRQNANLFQVKADLAAQAKAKGANAIVNFAYGQRAHPWWEMFALKWDTESWHGAGDAVTVTSIAR